MGQFDPYRLTDWHRDHGAVLVDPNRSLPIGKTRKVSSVEATLIHVDDSGTVVYGKEVELQSIQGCPLELPEEVEPLLGVRRLTGWLIYTTDKKYRNHDLVVTEFPARNLYFQSKLRLSSHHKKSEIVKAFQRAIEKTGLTDPIRAISEGLSSLSFQPFESHTGVASAWLIEPKRIEELSITQRTRGRKIGSEETIQSSLRGNFKPEKAEWSLGICEDIDRCIEFLQIDEEKNRLFERTANGDLFKHYRANPDRDQVMPNKDKHYQIKSDQVMHYQEYASPPQSGPVYRLMTAIAADLREQVFRAAIMTALAGIDESMYPVGSKGRTRPVIQQVKLLYHQIMYALVKRCYQSNPVKRSSEDPSSPAFEILLEELEELSEELRPCGRDAVMAGLEKTASGTDSADETLARLILAAPKEWALSVKLVAWLRRHQTQFSNSVQTMIGERLRAQEKGATAFSS